MANSEIGKRGRGWHFWLRLIWITGGLSFTAWIVWNMEAHGVRPDLLASSAQVTVTTSDDMILFVPTGPTPRGPHLVFLPGGGVNPEAYVPLLRRFADGGMAVALVRLPWRMAFTDESRRETWARVLRARDRLGQDRLMVLAGHSRGAALAGNFAASESRHLAGLVMIGTTHPRDVDLSSLTVPVLKVAGTADCVASLAASKENSRKLPATTTWAVIEGANHAQFGYYGSQLGDCDARISRDEQQQKTFDSMVKWLSRLQRQ